MNNILKLSFLSLGLITAGCSSSGGGGGETTAATNASASSILSSGSLAAETSGSKSFTAQRLSSSASVVTIDGKTYNVSSAGGVAGLQVSNGDDLIYIPSGNFGINEGRHVDTSLYIRGRNLSSQNSSIVSDVGSTISGTLTPEANLPSTAFYRGNWNAVATDGPRITDVDGGEVGTFSATADFGARQEVTGTLRNNTGQTAARLNGDIEGNQFTGTLSDTTSSRLGDVNGGFYGPNAEEIAGAGAFEDGQDKLAISFIGSR